MDCGELCAASHRWGADPVVDLVASIGEEMVHWTEVKYLAKQ